MRSLSVIKRFAVLTAALVALLFSNIPANAQSYYTGDDLYAKLQDNSNSVNKSTAIGYIVGVADSYRDTGEFDLRVNVDKLVDIVSLYLKNNPQLRHSRADRLVVDALIEAFPHREDIPKKWDN